MNVILLGFIGSLLAGLGTTLGALPILLPITLSDRTQGILLGLGGGVMLAATSFSLIVPGSEFAVEQGASAGEAALIMGTGILLGSAVLWWANKNFPHEHIFKGREGPETQNLKRIWLFVIAITLHNFPEGLAVGVGFGGGEIAAATTLAIGIGLQNIPEGLVVALALRNLKYSALYALSIATLTGLVEPVGGLIGVSIISIAQPLLPWGMAFAAGAMLFVIVDEIIPEVDQKSLGQSGTFGLIGGFVIMMILDIGLG
ncbi:MAG: ZIP family metal transporter [Leptolyngbyaceae cyanobacterium SL_1_1]|nr:ZIP family metal transporter [Leptolyngbyaceae cyanobacterium RM2_2_21]NJN03939.1 ZIP family metal transporter [Leptolyngbyaceae cyanobacterium RM1_1_2]NJO09412.1 ZIP family metal transporter [Leptolyngbyaceae cyanobacterium SL_1_1]